MHDEIREAWLQQQFHEAMSCARHSDILDLAPVGGKPPYRYLARFRCAGLALVDDAVTVIDEHLVGIRFPADYQRTSCDPGQVLTWLEPVAAFAPNIRAPFCCVGHIPPGMPLLSLLQQLYQMISWQRFTPDEGDALNPRACRWARLNLDRLPIDRRRSLCNQRPARDDQNTKATHETA